MKHPARWLCVTLAACLTAAGCSRPADTAGDGAAMFTVENGRVHVPEGSPIRKRLVIGLAGASEASPSLDIPATVEADPRRVANILSPVTGRIVSVNVALGDHVRRGQTLAVIASGDHAQAMADVEKAADALQLARRSLERAEGVRAAGGGADKDVEAARSAHAQAEAELTRARARAASLGPAQGGRNLILSAPQDGVVTALAMAPGAQVSDPTAVLMTVTNVARLYVTAAVPETDLSRVSVGMEAEVRLVADPTAVIRARIGAVNPVLEPDTRREKVRMVVDNADGRLKPNMYATVRIATTSDGVWAPQSALLMNNDATTVLVETGPWTFERRRVQLGDETADQVQVVSGLSRGERIVTRGGILLND